MLENVKSFATDESGASAVEYALLVAGIGTAVAAAVALFDFNTLFTNAFDGSGVSSDFSR